jgi:hypothetical protein
MTTPPINLTKLRHDIRLSKDAGYPIDITAKQALALIDTAEAAIDLLEHLAMIGGGQKVEQRYLRLRETLNHYTTTP